MNDFILSALNACLSQSEITAVIVGALLSSIGFIILAYINSRSRRRSRIRDLTEEIISHANSYFSSPDNGTMINILTKVNVLGSIIKKETSKKLNISNSWTNFRIFVANDEPPRNPRDTWKQNIELSRSKADDFLRSMKYKI